MLRNDAKFSDSARDKYGIVSLRGMTCHEWLKINYFGSLIILLKLIDVRL